MVRSWNRRQILQSGLVTGITAFAGCTTDEEEPIRQTASGTPDAGSEPTTTETEYDESDFTEERIANPSVTEFMYESGNQYRALLEDTEMNNNESAYLEFFVRDITTIHGETRGESNELRNIPDPMSEIGGRYVVGTGLAAPRAVNCSLIEVYRNENGAEKAMANLRTYADGEQTSLNGAEWFLVDSADLDIPNASNTSSGQYYGFSRANNVVGAVSVVKAEFSNPKSVLRSSIEAGDNEYGLAGVHIPTLNLLDEYREATIEFTEIPSDSADSEFSGLSFSEFDEDWFSDFIETDLGITDASSISEDNSFGGLDVARGFTVSGEMDEPPAYIEELSDSYSDEFVRNDGSELTAPPYQMDVTMVKFENDAVARESQRDVVFNDEFDMIRRYRANSCNGNEVDMAEITRRIGSGTDERGFYVDMLHAVVGPEMGSSSSILPDNGVLMRQGDWMLGRCYLSNDSIMQINWKIGQNYAGCGDNSWLPR